ncbi:Putative secreted protein [marine actinobacterium PHSC20C1]|nr:Putative secreted protein [marine actinobacterium PHSC20C1]
MVPHALPLLAVTDVTELVRGTTIAVAAIVVLVLALGAGAFVVLFRRGGDRGIRGTASQTGLDSRAAALLVALDDRVREAENEVGFAEAQFGVASTRDFDSALNDAREQLTEAFRLGQQRDTEASTADRVRRSLSLQMIALCEKAVATLDHFDTEFTQRRRTEVGAAETANTLRSRLQALRDRQSALEERRSEAAERYVAAAIESMVRQLSQASESLREAEQQLDAASPEISPTGVNAVADVLRAVAVQLHRADQLLSAVERSLEELSAADAAVERMRHSSTSDLREAHSALDSAPDPATGAQIVAAIAAVKGALSAATVNAGDLRNPLGQLAAISDASTQLDGALASARNQQQRFDHARAAYEGTLVAARSQISVARELVGRGGASARARTRLAEAERQLVIAEAETDPVEALDAIRRSVTHARDADALARY